MGQQPPDISPATPTPPERPLARALAIVVPRDNPAAAVYGLLATGALLAAESGVRETYLDTILAAAVAAALYWLLHAYGEVLGDRLVDRHPMDPAMLVRALGREWAVMRGAAIPIGALVISWAAGADQATGVTVALWSAIGALLAFELVAALRVHASARELLLDVTVGVAMGLAILALKIILH